jgi:nickel/cobalt exporter
MAPVVGLPESLALCLTAIAVGMVHTLAGPDHYIPFVAMSRAGGWSLGKTLRVTATCGLAHVASSVLIGLVGLAIGLAVTRLEVIEACRGDVAAWLMIGFGLAYLTWALVRAGRSHGPHDHDQDHANAPAHLHGPRASSAMTGPVWSPWLLFLVFAFGPCEPLIPLLMVPTAKTSWWAVAAVVLAFAGATITTMGVAVVMLRGGALFVPAMGFERHSHALAGAAILACGVLIALGF